MPIGAGNLQFERWRRDDSPASSQVEYAQAWLGGLDEMPRREPSRTVERGHPHVLDELRSAWLIDADAFVVYALDKYGVPRLLHIGRQPPEGITFGM